MILLDNVFTDNSQLFKALVFAADGVTPATPLSGTVIVYNAADNSVVLALTNLTGGDLGASYAQYNWVGSPTPGDFEAILTITISANVIETERFRVQVLSKLPIYPANTAPRVNSYGASSGVAALVPRYAAGTDFSGDTFPTRTQVIAFVDQISALVNAMLSEAGFKIPVTQADAVLSLRFFIEQEVAAIAEGINGSGRFGPTTKEGGGKGRFALLVEDVEAFVESHMIGLERLGATRLYSVTANIATRDTDERGRATFPIFQRDAFGNVFKDWDGNG